MQREITYNDIMQLNSQLYEQEIYYKLSYIDGSKAALWSLGACACDGKGGVFREYVNDYFKKKGLEVRWDNKNGTFSVTPIVISVVAAILLKDGQIFAAQRGYGEFKGLWEFPGGKIQENEQPKEALVREIREELNAEIVVGDLVDVVEYDYPSFHLSMQCYLCTLSEGGFTLLEHEDYKWLSIKNLHQVKWLPADLVIVEKIEQQERIK